MSKVNAFFKRKDIEVSLKRYGIDALGAMAQGLFCTLLVGTILDTLGTQLGISFLAQPLIEIGETGYTIGKFASAMVGPAMAVAIGYALHAPAMVLFSLIPVGYATNVMGGAGGPLAVYVVAIVAAEFGKMVSKETKIDILVTPIVTILIGIGAAYFIAAPIGKGSAAVCHGRARFRHRRHCAHASDILGGDMRGAEPHGSCRRRCACRLLREHGRLCGRFVQGKRLGRRRFCLFKLEMNGAAVSSGMGTCGLVGPIGVWTGWSNPSAEALLDGAAAIIPTAVDWIGLALIAIVLPAVLSWVFGLICRKLGWIKDGDMKLN